VEELEEGMGSDPDGCRLEYPHQQQQDSSTGRVAKGDGLLLVENLPTDQEDMGSIHEVEGDNEQSLGTGTPESQSRVEGFGMAANENISPEEQTADLFSFSLHS